MSIKRMLQSDFTKTACTAILLVALLSVTLLCFSGGISGNDFWWHIKVGEWVVEYNEVPTTDIFSWYGTEKEISWTAHEWLADVVFYGIHSLGGNVGVFAFCVVCAFAMILLMYAQARKHIERNFLIGGLFLVLFAVVSSLFFYGRPHIFSYFLLFLELKFLYEFFENPRSRKIYFIPIIAILWSNLHGGSSNLTYILCLIFLIAGAFNFTHERVEAKRLDKRALLILLLVTFGTVIGIFINPIGTKVLTYPYVSLSNNLSMSVISEWQAPDAKVVGNLILYFFPIFLMTIGIVCGNKKIRIVDILVMLAFLFLFFRSARFIVLWYIAAVFYAFRYVPEVKIKKVTKRSERIAVLSLICLLCIPCILGVADTIKTYKNNALISEGMSQEAVQAVKMDAPARIYNDYNLGETLIYNDIPVFFDARADLYAQEGIMADGISLMYLEPVNQEYQQGYVDVDAMINKYKFNAVLILKGRSLYSYIKNHPERFELVYEDDSLGYFRICGGQSNE